MATLESLETAVKLLSKNVSSQQSSTDTILAEILKLNQKIDQLAADLAAKRRGG